MNHGKIVDGTYIKHEDEKQIMRMSGGSWSIKLDELTKDVKQILYITEKGKYRIDIDIAMARGFERPFETKNGLENKLIVPLKHWEIDQLMIL